jgi:hypothetical protein
VQLGSGLVDGSGRFCSAGSLLPEVHLENLGLTSKWTLVQEDQRLGVVAHSTNLQAPQVLTQLSVYEFQSAESELGPVPTHTAAFAAEDPKLESQGWSLTSADQQLLWPTLH